MPELDSRQTQPLQIPESMILERRKQAILNLIDEMSQNLPPMVQMMVRNYRSMVSQSVDALTYEQTEELINKVQGIIDDLRG